MYHLLDERRKAVFDSLMLELLRRRPPPARLLHTHADQELDGQADQTGKTEGSAQDAQQDQDGGENDAARATAG